MAGFGPFPAALMSLANNVTADSGMKALKGNPFKYTIWEIDQGIIDSGLHKKGDNKLSGLYIKRAVWNVHDDLLRRDGSIYMIQLIMKRAPLIFVSLQFTVQRHQLVRWKISMC